VVEEAACAAEADAAGLIISFFADDRCLCVVVMWMDEQWLLFRSEPLQTCTQTVGHKRIWHFTFVYIFANYWL